MKPNFGKYVPTLISGPLTCRHWLHDMCKNPKCTFAHLLPNEKRTSRLQQQADAMQAEFDAHPHILCTTLTLPLDHNHQQPQCAQVNFHHQNSTFNQTDENHDHRTPDATQTPADLKNLNPNTDQPHRRNIPQCGSSAQQLARRARARREIQARKQTKSKQATAATNQTNKNTQAKNAQSTNETHTQKQARRHVGEERVESKQA
jgi:hypothetical protein